MNKIIFGVLIIIALIFSTANASRGDDISGVVMPAIEKIEQKYSREIGLYAINTSNNKIISHRANLRFAIQSTFKLVATAALLKNSEKDPEILAKQIQISEDDIVFWHPVTGMYLPDGKIALLELAEAAMSYSDNTATNLVMENVGGPTAVTKYAAYLGNKSFLIENYEVKLNSNPNKISDTSTPMDMAKTVEYLLLGDALSRKNKELLLTWMRNNTTGYKRIRAGLPIGWSAAEKTGGGSFGVANDIGIIWSPVCKPIVLAIYTRGSKEEEVGINEPIARATEEVINEFSQYNSCFEATRVS